MIWFSIENKIYYYEYYLLKYEKVLFCLSVKIFKKKFSSNNKI